MCRDLSRKTSLELKNLHALSSRYSVPKFELSTRTKENLVKVSFKNFSKFSDDFTFRRYETTELFIN